MSSSLGQPGFNLIGFFSSSLNRASSCGLNVPHLIDRPPWGASCGMVTGFALWPVTLGGENRTRWFFFMISSLLLKIIFAEKKSIFKKISSKKVIFGKNELTFFIIYFYILLRQINIATCNNLSFDASL